MLFCLTRLLAACGGANISNQPTKHNTTQHITVSQLAIHSFAESNPWLHFLYVKKAGADRI
jgi:hypothetical protein